MGCPDAELSIVITDDAELQALNRTYRGKDKPTDVLSFSQLEEPSGGLVAVGPETRVLGDVVISAETAARQAARFKNDFEGEIERLIVHGVCHLLGHDHIHGGPQARRMRALESRLMRSLRERPVNAEPQTRRDAGFEAGFDTVIAGVAGLLGALGFPLVLPFFGDTVLFESAPREVLLFVSAGLLYRLFRPGTSRRRRAFLGLIAGTVHFTVVLFWLYIAMSTYGGMPVWQAVPALGLLVVYCALYWAVLPLLTDLTAPVVGSRPLAFGTAVVVSELCCRYAMVRNQPVLQWASITGVYGLSLLVALLGAFGAHYVEARKTPGGLARGLVVLALLILPYGLGHELLRRDLEPLGAALDVAVLQGSIDQHKKNAGAAYKKEIVETYRALSHRAVDAGAELVIWPEAAWPGHILERTKRLPDAAAGVPVLIGVSLVSADRKAAYNSALWLDAGGEVQARYDKAHLVPFGEYVPARWLLPVERVVPGLVDYRPGTSPEPLGEPRTGVLICYDGIFPEIARAQVQAGAELLANLTNDAWYGISSGPYQHKDFYLMRAVETGRWVARAANSGMSFFVDPRGGVHEPTRLGDATFVMQRIQPLTGQTFYVRAGNWVVALAVGTCLAAGLEALAALWRRRQESSLPD